MNYSRLQKWLSSFLIFSLLFLQTFNLPMLDSTRAEAKVNADIVSFIVDDALYSDAVKSRILQYAQDVQAYLPNTRVVIFPVQKTANPFNIASINEKLFYEGDGAGLSRLVGTVLIGEVPLPVVHKDGKAFMSVYPYVDFDMKSFMYDQTKKYYEYTTKTLTEEKPEIWHSVIRPNTGDVTRDADELVTFFNKSHDFYNKQGLFSAGNTPTEPRVFYMDALHDQKTASADAWKWYNLYLENIEDIVYHRFNKYLAKKLYSATQGAMEWVTVPSIQALIDANSGSTMDMSKAPDITTKDIIEKSVKQFFEVFNAKYMGDVLRYVHNTGRYGDTTVRVDSTPVVIAKRDLFMRTTLKDTNTLFETAIDNLLKTQLAEPIRVATTFTLNTKIHKGLLNSANKNTTRVYKNYFFWQEASTIADAKQCSIVRGSTTNSWVIVEANRGYGIKNIQSDVAFLSANPSAAVCLSATNSKTLSYWWGNSGLNLDKVKIQSGDMSLNGNVYNNFIKPIFDITGSKELTVISPLHIATTEDCLVNNMLLQPYNDGTNTFGNTNFWPTETNGVGFDCRTVHKPLTTPFSTYATYNSSLPSEACTKQRLELDGVIVKESGSFCTNDGGDNGVASTTAYTKTYSFKTLSSSIVEHKSPTDEEYAAELKEMITPSLPSDRERYVDFFDKNLVHRSIVYPNLFRITLTGAELNSTGAQSKIKALLDAKTAEIKSLGGNIDLYQILSSQSSALNAAIESVIWNNMKNATLKYSNALERSLNIDGESSISANGKKNDYEIAYIGAVGDAKNMYLKVDPGAKSPLSAQISGIINQMNSYQGLIDGTNIINSPTNPGATTTPACGPPEGVPISEWLSAISCWLKTILPATVSPGSCGGSSSEKVTQKSSIFATPANALDANKNGIIDGNEIIGSGELKFPHPGKVFGYGQTVPLTVELTKNGNIIDIDSFNMVSFDIKKLTVISTDGNATQNIVYDKAGNGAVANIANIDSYVNFRPMQIRAKNGIASYSFTSKNNDFDIILDARILTKDLNDNIVVDKTSQPITISVRYERISVQSQTKTGTNNFVSSSVITAGNPNGILFNLKKINKSGIVLSGNTPYTLRVYDDINNTLLRGPINIPSNTYTFNDSSLLNKSGVYRFEFTDTKGIGGSAVMTVLPALPTNIEVTPSSNILIAGQKTTVLVRVLDAFGNLAKGEMYKLNGSISGGAEFIDVGGKVLGVTTSKDVVEGYTSFDIINKQTSDAMNLSFRIDRVNISSNITKLRSIDFAKIQVEVDNKGNIIAGKAWHALRVRILDRNNQVITGYNGIVSLDIPKLSGTFIVPFTKIVNGVSESDIILTPGTVAAKDIRINVQVPGINTVEGNIITVLPDVPMSFTFAKTYDRMEAREGNLNNTRAKLYDRYGNIAYLATGYSLTLEIPEEYKKYATLSKTSGTFTDGIVDFDIGATVFPGKAYIIGTVTPGLESNSFTITDKSNTTITVKGVSRNLTTLDTYYVFNKSKLDTMKYGAQYSVLLGGEYGDVTQRGYLGGEILFNHNSKSLAVTTLLNNPWKEQELFGFTPAGKYTYIQKSDDTSSLQATFSNTASKSYISFYDSVRKDYIARAWLNIDPSVTSFLPCTGTGTDITNCEISSQTTVFMKGFSGNTSVGENGWLALFSQNGTLLLRIDRNGKMEKSFGIELELDRNIISNLLGIKIVSGGVQMGYIGMKFVSDTIEIVSSSGIDAGLASYKNMIVFETLSNKYISHKTHLGVSSKGSEGIMFAFRDMSASEIGTLDNVYMMKAAHPDGLEDYPKKAGIGWEGTNRMFLEVAAGTTIGNATKFYQTFSTITLGDAVSHLPRIVSATSNFDRTIGTQLTVGNGEQIESYKKIDANGDGVSDIVIFYESGKIQLLMNYAGSFKDMGYLAYVADAGKLRKWVGNFFGDSYEDIALTDSKWRLLVLDNVAGKFTRTYPLVINTSGVTEDLHGQIRQLEVFDMDADGKTDIITTDDSGEINILYGNTRIVSWKTEHFFTKKLIENGLGMKLSKEIRNDGGAFSYAGLQLPPSISNPGNVNQDLINNIIYYQYNYISASGSGIVSGTGSNRVFVHSPFVEGKGLKVEKTYRLMESATRDTLQTGDRIRVEIKLTNISSQIFRDAVYLDSNEAKLFQEDSNGTFILIRNGKEEQFPLRSLITGNFDFGFDFANIARNETITIQYLVTAIPTAFGKIQVGLLEGGEAWNDAYGDIALSPNNMCGANLTMWRSIQPYARTYERGTKTFVDNSVLPAELQKNAIDLNKNGIPDYIDELIASSKSGWDTTALTNYTSGALAKFNPPPSATTPLVSYDPVTGNVQIGGLSSGKIDEINNGIDEVVKWLGCGFWGGSCITSPLNYAPLAPGSAPTLMGMPLMPLTVNSGLPIFSAMTGFPLYGPWGCIPIPMIWPISPIGLESTCTTNTPGAGWWLGTTSPSNFFRLFITPTITGAVGMAMCFGGPAAISGNIPPAGASPLVPGGNCIVAAKPLNSCAGDGSSGDIGSQGLLIDNGDGNTPSFNANSCTPNTGTWPSYTLLPNDRKNILQYVSGNNAYLPEINASLAQGKLLNISSGPLIGIGLGGGGSEFETSLDLVALANLDFGNIVKIKNKRVSAEPWFLMDWVNNQLEEIINKITSLPTLYIILPDFSGFDISGYVAIATGSWGLWDTFSEWKAADKTNYAANAQSKKVTNTGGILEWAQNLYNNAARVVDGEMIGKNVSGIKSVYEFMSHLPLLKLETEMIDISVPWLSFEEMDKWLTDAKLTLKQWENEFADKKEKWARLGSASGVDKQIILDTEWLLSSLQENINIIEEYKRFPEKFLKYLTWKERYMAQILCNIESIELMMGGWIADNGKIFRTWVELYILIKAILKSWQLIIDLFYGYEEECATCANERQDLKHFMFKLISGLIPSIPIITFPKLPDIWLDLHNIRAGIRILLPEYHFNFVPIILPTLPRLALPDVPTVRIGLPTLGILPRLPNLPDLPDLPSLPNIKLPDLPPPPTIPKLPTSIAWVLEIFKLIAKILCIMKTNPFVPEWRAGDQIAQITERNGTLPTDFLKVEFPQFSYSYIDAIKVTSFINLEFETSFIIEMSKAALNPLNQFTNDLSNIGSIAIPDINLQKTVPSSVDIELGGAPGEVKPNVNTQGYNQQKNNKINKKDILASLLGKLSFDVLHNFVALNRYMEKHSQEEVTVQVLKDILTENIQVIRGMNDPDTLAITDTLQKAVSYQGEKEEKFIQDLLRQNTEKFHLIKDFIQGEKREVTRLKTEMNTLLRTDTSKKNTVIPSFLSFGGENVKVQYISPETLKQDDVKQKILALNNRILPSFEQIKNGEKDTEVQEIQDMGKTLVTGIQEHLASVAYDTKKNDDIHRIAYTDSTSKLLSLNSTSEIYSSKIAADSVPLVSTSSTASSYTYAGIYILDNNGKQVRLFDYIDAVDGTEEVMHIDTDKDGDNDIIYRMNNSLYLKQNSSREPNLSHFSDSPKVWNWQDFLHIVSDNGSLRVLSAPNHFTETFTTSNEINFSFQPAKPLTDNLFRLEYYDYIDRFDKIDSGELPVSIQPKATIHKVDIIPNLPNETVFDTTHVGFVWRNNTVSFGRGVWEAIITMNTYQQITPETNGTTPIIISQGRTVYAAAWGAVIEYLRDGETQNKTLSFASNTNYEFLTNTKIWVKSGKLYLFSETPEQKTFSINDLRGMPVLPGTVVEVGENSSTSLSYYDGSSLYLDGPGTYKYHPLWNKVQEYNVSLAVPNDWYYAKLYSLEKNINSTAASLHLLSPQQAADKEGPLINYGEKIRVPVYQTQKLNLVPYLVDISGVNNVWIDSDLTRDTNRDGDIKNDADSLDINTTYGIKKGNTIYDLDLGPFDTLLTKKIRLFAEDSNKNISSRDMTLEVYAPVPEIKTISGALLSGILNETLANEPIDIFRLRNSIMTRIQPNTGSGIRTGTGGTFTFLRNTTSSGIILTQSGNNIATINEKTGKITLENTSFHIAVVPATATLPLQIQILNTNNIVVFSQKIDISTASNMEQVSNFDQLTGNGILVYPTTGFSLIKNTLSSPSLPGGGYIVDTDSKAIAGISKWGDIYILDTRYSLSYTTKDSYIVLRLQDASQNIIANILYKINAEYIMK